MKNVVDIGSVGLVIARGDLTETNEAYMCCFPRSWQVFPQQTTDKFNAIKV